MTCTCDYNLLRKGLADEQCEECYKAFVEKEEKYYKMLDGINALMLLYKDTDKSVIYKNTLDELFEGVI